MSRLADKVAVITGASRGIGAAIAEAFAREGARVVVASRKPEGVQAVADRINAAGGEALAQPCHVGKAEDVDTLIDAALARFGKIDVLVNNAATNPYFGPILGIEDWAWDKIFEVNLKGYFMPTRRVCNHLLEREAPGSIINIASIAAMRAAPMQGVYAMTKAAVVSMTQTLALELGGAKIRVNAIAPGLIETRLSSALVENEAIVKSVNDRTALGRVGQPEEIAGAAVFLASDESSFITGATLVADGGYTVH